MSNRIVTGIAGIMLAAFALGCSENDGPTADVTPRPIELSPASMGLIQGTTGTFTAVAPDGSSPEVTWESSNTSVATVNATGRVTAIGAGVAAITARLASDASVLRSASVTVILPPLLTSGTAVTGIAAATGTQLFYRVNVPAGATSLVVQMSGGTGDADLYTRPGAVPTFTQWTCRPWAGGNNETCTHTNPTAGTWYIMLDAYEGFSGVTLRATVTP